MLLRLLPLPLSITWGFALHILLAGTGMYFLCRRLNLNAWIALACAFSYMLSGKFIDQMWVGSIWMVYALAWLPLAWLFLIDALDSGHATAIVKTGLVFSLIVLTGHPTMPAYILMFMGFYWLYQCLVTWNAEHSWRAVAKQGLRFSGILLFMAGFAAIQLIPTLILAQQASLSQGYGIAAADEFAVQFPLLATIFVPNFLRTYHFAHFRFPPSAFQFPISIPSHPTR